MANPEHLEILRLGVEVWDKWREENPDMTPDLSGADLSEANLGLAILSEANLSGADLGGADLIGANLSGADLIGANLSGADLGGADLGEADLRRANLTAADLGEADLGEADLRRANLTAAILSGANLRKADLRKANLTAAILSGADLIGADLSFAKLDLITMSQIPEAIRKEFSGQLFVLNYDANSITRSIEFPPEYKQAGVSILNYFSEVLNTKYPEAKATVQIKQDGLKVTMVIDPVDGDRDVIERTLDEYGLVITGKMAPEVFTDDKHMILELKQELRMAQLRVETQKDLLQDKSAQVDKLLAIVGDAVRRPINLTQSQTVGDKTDINGHDVSFAKNQGKARIDKIGIKAQDITAGNVV